MLTKLFRSSLFFSVVLVACSLALYGQSLGFNYVWDDSLLFLDRAALINDPLSWSLLSVPVLPGTTYMRPLTFLSWFIEFKLFGQNPFVSHLINVLIFSANVLLVFSVSKKLLELKGKSTEYALKASFLAAVFYLVHPAMVESVAWVSGRFDLMATLFILAAVRIYLSNISEGYKTLNIALLMFAALFSKELGLVLPGILLCIWLACEAQKSKTIGALAASMLRENGLLLLCLIMVLVVYAVIRALSMDGLYHNRMSYEYIKSVLFENLWFVESLKFYFGQILWPFSDVNPLHPIQSLSPHKPMDLFLSGLMVAFLTAGVIWTLIKRTASSWLFVAGFLCLLPVLHLVPLTIGGNIGHERFLTTALAFIALGMALINYESIFDALLSSIGRLKSVFFGFLAVWYFMAVFTVSTIIGFWSSDLTLWNWAYKANPEFEFARYNYMFGALKYNRKELIDKEVERLIEKNGSLNVAEQIIYSNILIRAGNEEGLKYIEGVIYALPKFHELPNGFERSGRFMLSRQQMGGIYFDYAMAILIFNSDVESALKYNEIAGFYFGKGERIPLLFQKAAFLYAADRFEEAEEVLESLKPVKYHVKDNMYLSVKQILWLFCNRQSFEAKVCTKLVEHKVIER